MAIPEIYKTVEKSASDEFVEKKSRFIGYAAPIHNADEALDFVKTIKKKHNDARHNCFAYRLLDGSERYSDDGEPQGTAGQPILDVLSRGGICDCVVVVTRYFGGVLLGTGGLTRAYTNGAKLAVSAAEIIEMIKVYECKVGCDYTFYGSLQTLLAKYDVKTNDSNFSDRVELNILVKPEKYDGFLSAVTELTAGKEQVEKISEKFIKKY